MPVTLNITYCGGWGYKRYADALAMALEDKFGADVRTTFSRDKGVTGNFEVTIVETNTLIHSKKAGKGKCESQAEKDAVFAAVEQALAK